MTSELQRDVELIEEVIARRASRWVAVTAAWQRIRARLEALEAMAERLDRGAVAKAMLRANSQNKIGGDGAWPSWEILTPPQQANFLHIADAAIAAIKGQTP